MTDTITALSTAPGISGIAVIRLSGENAFIIADKLFQGKIKVAEAKTHTVHYGKIFYNNICIDEVTVSVFKSPNSYTGENVAEISCHGTPIIYNAIIQALIDSGARLAEPGEFTKRAFLNGRIDLTQVEAVADIIHSTSTTGVFTSVRQLEGGFKKKIAESRKKLLNIASLLEIELDFSDEDIKFTDRSKISELIHMLTKDFKKLSDSYRSAEIFRSGFFVSIVGYPNSGKSTLFNSIISKNRAIVSDIPGTTRDYIEENILYKGQLIKFIDTAGLRSTEDTIENQGIIYSGKIIEQSNLILVLNDISKSEEHSNVLFSDLKDKYSDKTIILIQNKSDLKTINQYSNNSLYISAKHGQGIETLMEHIYSLSISNQLSANDILINQRQAFLLNQAVKELEEASESLNKGFENEFIALNIRNASNKLGEISGEKWSDEVLNNIFSNFCIGK